MSTAQSSEGENAALLAENAALLAENARLRRSADGAFACDPAGRAPRACTRTVYAVAVVAADAKFASLSVCFRSRPDTLLQWIGTCVCTNVGRHGTPVVALKKANVG